MRFSEIKSHIVNREGYESIDALRQAGYRLVKARDDERYFLARESDLHPLLVRLGDIAEVRFGIKTGANEFFYLEPIGTTVAELFRAGTQQPSQPTVRVRNGAGWQGELETAWLRPVIKSPRELKTLRVRLEDLRYLVFMPPAEFFSPSANSLASATNAEKKILDDARQRLHDTAYLKQHYPHAHAYIQWGEGQGYQYNPTCAAREAWWALSANKSNIKIPMFFRERFFFVVSDAFCDAQLYDVTLKDNEKVSEVLVVSLLCNTMFLLQAEIGGRHYGGGGGPLKFQVYETKQSLIPNPSAFTAAQRERLLEAFERMAQREVRSIFEELGYAKPSRDYSNIDPDALTLEQVQRASPDRFELDAVVFEVLGLNDAERLAVYRAVVELVRNRLVKARSV